MELQSHRQVFTAKKVPGSVSDQWEIKRVPTNQVLGYYSVGQFTCRPALYTPLELLELHDLFIEVDKARINEL